MPEINNHLLDVPYIYTKRITEAIKSNKSVINLARGDSEFITPYPITDYLKKIIDEPGEGLSNFNKPVGMWTHYEKEGGSLHLKRSISQKYLKESNLKVSSDNILVTHGGMNAIFYSLMSILTSEDEVIIFDPAYIAYYPICSFLLSGVKVVRFPIYQHNDFEIDYQLLENVITKRTKAVIFTSPYNPCGKVYSYDSIKKLFLFCEKHDLFLIHDENHEKEIYDGYIHYPAMIFDINKDRTILLNSMSRLGMGGWRIGWMIANETIINAAKTVHAYVNMTCNTFVQECAAYALDHYDDLGLDLIFERYSKKRIKLCDFLNSIEGIECFVPQGTCYLFPSIKKFYTLNSEKILHEIKNSMWYNSLDSDNRLVEDRNILKYKSYAVYLFLLLKYYVGVLPGCCYGEQSDDHIRLSFSVKEEAIDEAINRLSALANL